MSYPGDKLGASNRDKMAYLSLYTLILNYLLSLKYFVIL